MLAKFFTSGPTVTVTSLPWGPFNVTSRVALSIAVIVAVSLTVCATPALPGALPAMTAPVCAATGPATAMVIASPIETISLCMLCLMMLFGMNRDVAFSRITFRTTWRRRILTVAPVDFTRDLAKMPTIP
jgi:hypothetical protein